uniref:Uncharacterized protein MANES_13G062000 n=1 Tax=Rhizophora mucronata TaxID=61149 RepID=A0A2P2KLH0_RHIMU
MVMGNASGKDDGEGSSGVKDAEGYEQEDVEFAPHGWGAQGSAYAEPEAMLHSPPLSPRVFQQPPLMFNPQVPLVPSSRLGEVVRAQNYASTYSTTDFRDVFMDKPMPVLIVWSYGGQQVAVTGSWDNWSRSELLQRSGQDFVLIKMLPSGVYHYHFIVDEHARYAPDLPLEFDDSGTGYNILDVQVIAESPNFISPPQRK